MMIGPAVMYSDHHRASLFIVAVVMMLSLDVRLTLMAVADPLPLVVDRRPLLRPGDSPALRARPGAALRDERDRPGSAGRACASSARTARSR